MSQVLTRVLCKAETMKLEERFYRFFIRYIGYLGIFPELDFEQENFRKGPVYNLMKVILLATFSMTFFIIVSYVEFDTLLHSKLSSLVLALNISSSTLGFCSITVMFFSTLKRGTWEKLITIVDIFHKYHHFTNRRFVRTIILFIVFIFIHVLFLYMDIQVVTSFFQYYSIWISLIMLFPNLELIIMFMQVAIVLIIICEIRRVAQEARLYLNMTDMNVRKAKRSYINSLIAVRCFNSIFGYQMLIGFAQWMVLFETICLDVATSNNPDKFNTDHESNLANILLNVVYLAFNTVRI
ncbi:hypothetical protein GWI33_015634 [Rhynchophorus ferrugineus]|uniref:Uncharacterized protein n=1 Tax=Rhynchophorus ferrugineus TaxID=354439 RepID=A0A834HYW2_RHYFE|nr:hypothetical protein GWI33_015634 [Rhynchophorus ferrugineus]